MISNDVFRCVMILLGLVNASVVCNAQSRNLLKNPNGDQGPHLWRAFGEATIEPLTGNNWCFVVRNGGYSFQDVTLTDNAVGQYAVFIGRGASERINDDGSITGLPYLLAT